MNSYSLVCALSSVFLIFFIMREYFAYKKNLFLKYFFTPSLTLILTIMTVLSIIQNGSERYRVMILLSLLMALIADTLLMIEEINLLKNGIIFFIMAHVFYIIAFSECLSFKPWNLILIAIIVFLNFIYIKKLAATGNKMLIPVLFYIFILNMMVYSAIIRLNNGVSVSAVLAASGAIMFIFSDFILSVNAFIKPVKNSTVITWLLYAPAQYLIVLSTFTNN